jgi:hypothetical protein
MIGLAHPGQAYHGQVTIVRVLRVRALPEGALRDRASRERVPVQVSLEQAGTTRAERATGENGPGVVLARETGTWQATAAEVALPAARGPGRPPGGARDGGRAGSSPAKATPGAGWP